jgi:single-strand DNA-binding protein
MNFNKVMLMGRLTRDPELRYTPQGVPVADLGLAVNREYTAGTERRKETVFIDVTLWRRQAEVCCQYMKKGSPIFIDGRLSMDSWEGQDGQKRTRYRVVAESFQFIGGREGGGGGDGDGGGGYGQSAPSESFDSGSPPDSGGFDSGYGQNFRQNAAPPQGAPGGDGGSGVSQGGVSQGGVSQENGDDDIPF